MSIKLIEGSNDFFEFAHELKYANKQIDKLRRELAELRKDYDEVFALLRDGHKLVRQGQMRLALAEYKIAADDVKAQVTS